MNNIIKYNYDFLIKNTEVETIWLNDDCHILSGFIKLKKQPFFERIQDTHKDKSIITADLESWLYNVMPPKDFKDKMLLRMLIFDIRKTRSISITTEHCMLTSTKVCIKTGYILANNNPLYYFLNQTNNIYTTYENILNPKSYINKKNILNFSNYHLNYSKNKKDKIDDIKDFNNNFKEDFILDKFIDKEDILILSNFIKYFLKVKNYYKEKLIVLKNQYHAEIFSRICTILNIDSTDSYNIVDNTEPIPIIDEVVVEVNVKNWFEKYLLWDEINVMNEIDEPIYKSFIYFLERCDSNASSFDYILFCYLMEYE